MSGGFPLIGLEICNGSDFGTVTTSSNGTALTGGANNTKGSYTQLTASTTLDICALAVCLQETNNTTRHCAVDIAVGASGSENVIISNLFVEGGTNGANGQDYLFPINIPAGTRISARAQNGSATADGPTANVVGFDGSFGQTGSAGIDAIGYLSATTYGTLLTASATANTKGSYVQLSASTPVDYAGFWIRPSLPSGGAGATAGLVDLAIGASGSELVILPNFQVCCVQPPATPHFLGPFWIPIPAGTRIAARMQATAASATCGLHLYGAYR